MARRRARIINEYKKRLLRAQLNPLPNNVLELPDSQVGRDEVLLLVDVGDGGGAGGTLADYGNAVRVL